MIGSVLSERSMQSPLRCASAIFATGNKKEFNPNVDINLTPLCDAFSILVIFLLMNFSASEVTLQVSKNMQLPLAERAKSLERTIVLKLDAESMYVDDQIVTEKTLMSELLKLRQALQRENPALSEFSLTIQADKRVKFDEVNKLILASNQAGFSEVKFAVVLN